MRDNQSMPACTVIPELAYPDVEAAAVWLCDAFGFTLRVKIGSHRAQLSVGDGAIVLTRLPAAAAEMPLGDIGLAHAIMVRVADVAAHHQHASLKGAVISQPPTDFPYGERQYCARDPSGHRWTFSESIADVAPEAWGATQHP